MTFVNINGTRIKVATVFVYTPSQSLNGTTEQYYIDVSHQTAGMQSRTTVVFSTAALRDAALQALDTAVLAFIELPPEQITIVNPVQSPMAPGV
jgi:hypothetical protein